jgi:hypothetical protein
VKSRKFGDERIKDRLKEIMGMWKNMIDEEEYRSKRLEEDVELNKLFEDEDDVEIWMMEKMRIV